MIVFDLECRPGGHRFEGWFSSSQDYASQQERGLVSCPQCGSLDVGKALMAPNVGRKGNQMDRAPSVRADAPPPAESLVQAMAKGGAIPPEAVKVMEKLAALQAEAIKGSRWVGDNFAEDARAMHYGEREVENIHGQATLEQAKELLAEGIEVAPLPLPIAPPGKAN